MSKEDTAGKPDGSQEEEFVIVEVDSAGKPIAPTEAPGHDSEDDDDDLDAGDADDSDERVGHSEDDDPDVGARADETPEERRERRRRENRAKRVRNRVAAESKDRLIQNQGRMLLTLQEQVAQLQGRTVRYDTNLLQNQLQQIESQQSDAKAVLAKLSRAGDHEGIAEVVEVQMNLRDQHRQITEQLRRSKTSKRNGQSEEGEEGEDRPAPRQQQRVPTPDPEVVRRAVNWAGKHAFADPQRGNKEEIEIVKAIDHNLHREGWDPKSDDYWAELTSRVKRRLPHHFKKAAPNGDGRQNGGRRVQDDTGGRTANGGPRMAPASQSSGGSRPLGKNEVRVTPDRKKAMQDAGMWDDVKKRNRMLAQYAKYDREAAEQ
jgi:hypothetical protein